MIKKIIILFFLLFSIFSINYVFWNCEVWGDLSNSLEACLESKNTTVLQSPTWDLKVTWWFKNLVVFFVENIATFIALLAIWSIAFWSLVIVASWWNEEKISKWRKIIIWSLVWFLALVSANGIIRIIVYLIYWFD